MKKILSLLLILLMAICFVACSDGLPWSESKLSRMIPIPVSTHREVVEDNEDAFSVDIYNFSQKMFRDYIVFCDAVGFRKDAEKTDLTYSAYHTNGAQLELYFMPEEGRMRIELVSVASRAFAEKVMGRVDDRLAHLEEDIAAVQREIKALPIYKTATPGEVTSTMETTALRGFVYRLSPTIGEMEERLAACQSKRGILVPDTLEKDLLSCYEEQETRMENVESALFSLRGSVYGLENALDSLHRQKVMPADLAALETALISVSAELAEVTKKLESEHFEIRVETQDETEVYLLDENAFYEALCETLPTLTDLGFTMEKYENVLFDLTESALETEADRQLFAELEAQVLKLRRSHYLSLDAAKGLEDILARYRAGEPLFPQSETVTALPNFPALQEPLTVIEGQIEAIRQGMAEIEASAAAGKGDAQPLIERAYSTLAKIQPTLTDCTEIAVKMRRAGTCYPETSPSSQPVFDGLEDSIAEYRKTLNSLMLALEQLEHSQNDRVLMDVEATVSGVRNGSQEILTLIQSMRDLIRNYEQITSESEVDSYVNSVTERINLAFDMQRQLGNHLNAVIQIKVSSLVAAEVDRAKQLEETIYELNGTIGDYIDLLRAIRTEVDSLRYKIG